MRSVFARHHLSQCFTFIFSLIFAISCRCYKYHPLSDKETEAQGSKEAAQGKQARMLQWETEKQWGLTMFFIALTETA